MKEDRRTLKTSTGRGTYARQACNHCRRRKSKCDGQQPVCGPCRDSGRADECTWGRETAKKARTQQHFESLVNHIKYLELRVKELESDLSHTQNIRRSASASLVYASTSATKSDGAVSRSLSPLGRQSPVLKWEHDDGDNGYLHAAELAGDRFEETGDEETKTEESDIDQLIAPTSNLVIQGGDVEVYGPTSAYRLAPERNKFSCATNDLQDAAAPSVSRHAEFSNLPYPPSSSLLDLDLNRYLPDDAPISRTEHNRLLDLLFRFCTSWCYRIIPSLFFRDMKRALSLPANDPPPRTTHYSPMLHNAMIALAAAFSDDPKIQDIEFRRKFAQKAKGYVEANAMNPSVCFVTALGLLATFYSSRGEQTLGYLYSGMSGRMTQALGLHIDCSSLVRSGRIKETDMHDRNWAYWATFTQDVCWSLYIGRECAMASPDSIKPLPVPHIDSEYDNELWVWEPSGLPPQKSNIASVFAATCDLLRIARRVLEFVNGLGTDLRHPNLQLVSELDIDLNAWKDSLPSDVDLTAATRPSALPHRLTLHLMYWWLYILLHRPFYRRTKSIGVDIDHVKLCNRAAENIMLLLGIWQGNYGLRYVATTHVQIVFSAGTVYVLSAIQAISGPRLGRVTLRSSLSNIEKCLEYLDIIGQTWETSKCAKDILLNFFDEQLKPRLLLRGGEGSRFDIPTGIKPCPSHIIQPQLRSMGPGGPGELPEKIAGQNMDPMTNASTVVLNGINHDYLPRTLDPLGDSQISWSAIPSSDSSTFKCRTDISYNHPNVHPSYSEYEYHDQHAPHPHGDMDLDVNYTVGMSMNIIPDSDMVGVAMYQPTSAPPVDVMSFGVPELGVGYRFEPSTQLDFSEEELAIMDQICRQQAMSGSYLYPNLSQNQHV